MKPDATITVHVNVSPSFLTADEVASMARRLLEPTRGPKTLVGLDDVEDDGPVEEYPRSAKDEPFVAPLSDWSATCAEKIRAAIKALRPLLVAEDDVPVDECPSSAQAQTFVEDGDALDPNAAAIGQVLAQAREMTQQQALALAREWRRAYPAGTSAIDGGWAEPMRSEAWAAWAAWISVAPIFELRSVRDTARVIRAGFEAVLALRLEALVGGDCPLSTKQIKRLGRPWRRVMGDPKLLAAAAPRVER